MNNDEAKQILLLYRPGTTDGEDPDTAAALAMAKSDPELWRWFHAHCERQTALREKFRQIPVLAGLKEQIISEQAAKTRAASRREKLVTVLAVLAIIASLGIVGGFVLPHKMTAPGPTLANFKVQMSYVALSGYSMDLLTKDSDQIQSYLAKNQAPADYTLPAGLQKVAVVGCDIQSWQGAKASMICFQTGAHLPAGQKSDLWLFVVDRAAVKDSADITGTQFATANGFTTATWTQGNNLYVLGVQGDESTIKKFL